MLEKGKGQRVILHKKVQGISGHIRWKVAKRIFRFPSYLSVMTDYNFMFSPDLMYYLDFSSNDQRFLIKESLSQNIVSVIPAGIMNA